MADAKIERETGEEKLLIHWVWYATLPNVSLKQKLELLQHFSGPEDIFDTPSFHHMHQIPVQIGKALENKDLTMARSVIKCCEEKQIGILTMADAGYPSRLKSISDPPLVLYYKGVLPDFEGRPVIGVVGTRKATGYGMNVARVISREIATCGGLVISGGAGGIDTAALHGAGSIGHQTVAVLGCGVNVVYPKTNRELFTQISKNGCLISEYLPDSEPKVWQFPERNRIISGLSNGVLVVEAPVVSGALITARNAAQQGRDVFVVPGNVGVATCQGSNALIGDIAKPVFNGWDILKEYAPLYPYAVQNREVQKPNFSRRYLAETVDIPGINKSAQKKPIDNPGSNAYSDLECKLSQQEKTVLRCLDLNPKPVDSVITQTGLPAPEVLRILTTLALKGMVVNHPGRMVSANYG